jgi:hypothetical protein
MGKALSGNASAVVCALAAPVFFSAPSFAQQVDAEALTECLISKTTDEHIVAMKRLMIAALQDNPQALKTEATNYGSFIVEMAMTSCGITQAQLTDPAVGEAIGAYGQKLGGQIITDAFARIR